MARRSVTERRQGELKMDASCPWYTGVEGGTGDNTDECAGATGGRELVEAKGLSGDAVQMYGRWSQEDVEAVEHSKEARGQHR